MVRETIEVGGVEVQITVDDGEATAEAVEDYPTEDDFDELLFDAWFEALKCDARRAFLDIDIKAVVDTRGDGSDDHDAMVLLTLGPKRVDARIELMPFGGFDLTYMSTRDEDRRRGWSESYDTDVDTGTALFFQFNGELPEGCAFTFEDMDGETKTMDGDKIDDIVFDAEDDMYVGKVVYGDGRFFYFSDILPSL